MEYRDKYVEDEVNEGARDRIYFRTAVGGGLFEGWALDPDRSAPSTASHHACTPLFLREALTSALASPWMLERSPTLDRACCVCREPLVLATALS